MSAETMNIFLRPSCWLFATEQRTYKKISFFFFACMCILWRQNVRPTRGAMEKNRSIFPFSWRLSPVYKKRFQTGAYFRRPCNAYKYRMFVAYERFALSGHAPKRYAKRLSILWWLWPHYRLARRPTPVTGHISGIPYRHGLYGRIREYENRCSFNSYTYHSNILYSNLTSHKNE